MAASKCLVSMAVLLMAAVCAVNAEDRIKLCGRDLVRRAVSTCGSSRLRRSVEPDQHDVLWNQEASTEEHWAPESSDTAPEADEKEDVPAVAPHWYQLSSRIRRSAATMTICCEKGCTLKELIQFC